METRRQRRRGKANLWRGFETWWLSRTRPFPPYLHLFYSSRFYTCALSQIFSRNKVLTPTKSYCFVELLRLKKHSGCFTQHACPLPEAGPPSTQRTSQEHPSPLHTHRLPSASWPRQRFWTFRTSVCAGSSPACHLSVPPLHGHPAPRKAEGSLGGGADPGKGSPRAARPNSVFPVSSAVCSASANRPQDTYSPSMLYTSLLAAFKDILIKNCCLDQFSLFPVLFTAFC